MRIIFVAATIITGAVVYEKEKVHVIKIETEKIVKEALDSVPIQFYVTIAAISMIAILLLAECIYQTYARKKHSVQKKCTERVENAIAMNV